MITKRSLLCIIACLYNCALLSKSAITNLPGSRLGDHLISYCKTKWIAYVFDLEYLYNPFDQSDKFALHDLEKNLYNKRVAKKYKKNIRLSKIPNKLHPNALYVSHYGTFIPDINPRSFDNLTITDAHFLDMLKVYLAPRYPMQLIEPPTDKKSIAVHVRKGGGFDPPLLSKSNYTYTKKQQWADKIWPTKFPPISYYIQQIRYIYHYYNNQDLYVFIFTDDQNPLAIVDIFKREIPFSNIEFDCRYGDHAYKNTTLEDFFSIPLFNCLIRPNSGFSVCAHLLGDFEVAISPKSHYWNNTYDTLVIDEVFIDIKKIDK